MEAVDRGSALAEELDPFVKSSVPWAATKCSSFSLVAGGSGANYAKQFSQPCVDSVLLPQTAC